MIDWVRKVFAEQSELVLVLMLAGVLLVLFAPIPPGLLDLLLITNFSIAAASVTTAPGARICISGP